MAVREIVPTLERQKRERRMAPSRFLHSAIKRDKWESWRTIFFSWNDRRKKTGRSYSTYIYITDLTRKPAHPFADPCKRNQRTFLPIFLSLLQSILSQIPSLYIVYTIIFMPEIFTNNIVIRVTVQEDVRTVEGEANCMCIFLLGVPEVLLSFYKLKIVDPHVDLLPEARKKKKSNVIYARSSFVLRYRW